MSTERPLILVTPSTQAIGEEMADHSVTVASLYLQAILDAGGLPLMLPLATDRRIIREAVARCAGVMITGGDDIEPRLYWPNVPAHLMKTCHCAEPARDVMELEVIREVLNQQKPLLAICRGHQLVNIALGGTLTVDLVSQRPDSKVNHRQLERKTHPVHRVNLALGSLLARLVGAKTLRVNSTHHQAVDELAETLQPVAVAPDGVVEAAELGEAHRSLLPWFLSVQFHPERLYDRFREHGRIFREFVRACRG